VHRIKFIYISSGYRLFQNCNRAVVFNTTIRKMWPFCGYDKIQDPPRRYRTIDLDNLVSLMGFTDLPELQAAHKRWVEASLQVNESKRESHWTESIAAGSKSFVEKVKGRSIKGSDGHYRLRENVSNFGITSSHGFEPISGADVEMPNTFFWDEIS